LDFPPQKMDVDLACSLPNHVSHVLTIYLRS
jgi:hypothetical protein